MFSKATLIGIVGIEPKYKAATAGKDSVIYFRLGCDVLTSSKKITEWYTIKAFGRVADYLHTSIKKDSSVHIEASIRSKKWVANGVERQGIEFHAFSALVMPDTNVSHHAKTNKASTSSPDASQKLPFPEMEKPRNPPTEFASRIRNLFEENKKFIADSATTVANSATATEVEKDFNPLVSTPPKEVYLSGNTETDNLILAKQALTGSSARDLNSSLGYAHVRGGWSSPQ